MAVEDHDTPIIDDKLQRRFSHRVPFRRSTNSSPHALYRYLLSQNATYISISDSVTIQNVNSSTVTIHNTPDHSRRDSLHAIITPAGDHLPSELRSSDEGQYLVLTAALRKLPPSGPIPMFPLTSERTAENHLNQRATMDNTISVPLHRLTPIEVREESLQAIELRPKSLKARFKGVKRWMKKRTCETFGWS
ncbi:hypothetical protein B0O99DRAFT_685222 [Bisporella sp. PMI_857]|nr:hypothetical protein B0O99DRAFT_685222 [Bisporella sp. PMI_857]